MDLTGLGSLADFLGGIIGKVFPDKTKALEIQAELQKALLAGQLQDHQNAWDNAKAQIAVNAEEAKNPSLFVSGWRPFCGWVGGVALAYEFLIRPLMVAFGHAAPALEMGDLLTILGGMLGLSGMRTAEKIKGVARK